MRTAGLLACAVLIVLTAACGEDGSAGSVAGVPEPGEDENGWRVFGAADIGTLEAAWSVGRATTASPYVEAILSRETGQAFFVFQAGVDEIQLVLQAPPGQPFVESVRLFAVADAERGEEITPSWSVPPGGTWPVVEGEVYLVEVTGPEGAFF